MRLKPQKVMLLFGARRVGKTVLVEHILTRWLACEFRHKVIIYDTGIRNAVIRDYRPYRLRPDTERGALWENYFISDRLKRNHNQRLGINFYFWRTYDQQEIDLIEEHDGQLTAIEMKSGSKSPLAPKAFTQAYPDAVFSVLNTDNYMDYV